MDVDTTAHHGSSRTDAASPAADPGSSATTAAPADLDPGTLGLDEAARVLGLSERTIRRMIKTGEIDAYKLKTPRGEVWRVRLGNSAPTGTQPGKNPGTEGGTPAGNAATTAADPGTPAPPGTVELVQLVDRLTRDNQQLAGQVGYLQARVQDQERQIALLMAPKDDAPVETPAEPEHRRPWWRRLLRGA